MFDPKKPGALSPSRALTVRPSAPVGPQGLRAGLVELFLAGRSRRTLRAYSDDLADFQAFVGAPTTDAAAARLLDAGHGGANASALAYRAHLLERGLAPATVNRRLAALRSLVKLARTLGLVPWTLDVPAVKGEGYRDTRGPGVEGVRALLGALADRQDAKGLRDRVIVRLLYDLALRRAEVVRLGVEDVDLTAGTVAVLGKGRREKLLRTLPDATRAALAAYLEVRGTAPGPLLVNVDRARKIAGGLTSTSVYRIVRTLGAGVGLTVRPHGLRHASITCALELTGGDVRRVQQFSRHADVRVLQRYDDNREDLAGEVAREVAATL